MSNERAEQALREAAKNTVDRFVCATLQGLADNVPMDITASIVSSDTYRLVYQARREPKAEELFIGTFSECRAYLLGLEKGWDFV